MKLAVEHRGLRMTPVVFAMVTLPFAVASAEQLFVDDKLVLNVYTEPNQGGDKVATLETGDAVEALERAENFVRVRLPDGREGWVGANYLTAEAPALIRLRELQREQKSQAQSTQKQSADEIARLQKRNAALQGELDDLKRQAAASTPSNAPEQAAPTAEPEPEVTPAPSTSTNEAPPVSRFAFAWAVLAVVTGVAGYALGYQTLARRVRKKFGGVKIY